MAEKIRALYVDDEESLLDLCKLFLERSGDFTVTISTSAPEAIRILGKERFDAIVADYQMPEMDGIEFLKHVRAIDKKIPFIIFTGKGREEIAIQAFENGADFYLQKGGEPKAQFAELSQKTKKAVEIRRAEEDLRQTQERYQMVFENTGTAMVVIEEDTTISMANTEFTRITGIPREKIEGKMRWTQFIVQEDLERMLAQHDIRRRNHDTALKHYEFRARMPSGDIRDISMRIEIIPGTKKSIASLLDITEYKKHEQALVESERELKVLFKSMINAFVLFETIFDDNGNVVSFRFVFINDAYERITGVKNDEVRGKTLHEVWPGTEASWIKAYGDVAVTGVSNSFEMYHEPTKKLYYCNVYRPGDNPDRICVIFEDITERKQAEESRARSEKLYRTLAEASPDQIFIDGRDDTIEYANSAALKLFRLPYDQVIGKPRRDFFPPEIAKTQETSLKKVFETGEPIRKEDIILFGEKKLWIDTNLVPLKDEAGNVTSILGIARDITERKQAEEALQLTNAMLTSQMEATIDGILVVDEAGKIISYNHRFTEIWGISPDVIASRSDELTLQSVLDKLVDPEEFLARVRYLYTHREEKSREEIRLTDNRTLDRYSAPMFGSDGRYYGRVWYFQDITSRKKAEQEIARIAREWETTFNATSDGICLIDANQNLIRCNNRMGEILGGIRHEDLVGKPCWVVVHKATGPIPECPFVSAKKTLKRTRIEIPAGDLWFEVTADPILDSSGTFAGAVHLMRDITERKTAEGERARLSAIVEHSDEAIIGETLEGIITSWNTGAERMYGYSAQEMVGKNVSLLVPLNHPDDTVTILEQVRTGEPVIRYETLRKQKDGRLINVTLTASPIRDAQNHLIGTSIIGHDITERKRAEDALRQANKQLNLLSSITRHDILNQLMALKGYLELSHEMIDNPTTLIEYINKEEKAANTIEAQITFTKDYQELGIAAPVWQNVNASIKKAVSGLPMRAVHVDFDPKDPAIFADPLFEKVFYNLIDNALRYGGAEMKTIRVFSQESDRGLTIVCEDDGVGVSAEDKKKLFTRGFGKHTGLGLFLTREILAITGITITENGTPGKGARFEITVPKGMGRMNGANE